jgi:hypothetical protein
MRFFLQQFHTKNGNTHSHTLSLSLTHTITHTHSLTHKHTITHTHSLTHTHTITQTHTLKENREKWILYFFFLYSHLLSLSLSHTHTHTHISLDIRVSFGISCERTWVEFRDSHCLRSYVIKNRFHSYLFSRDLFPLFGNITTKQQQQHHFEYRKDKVFVELSLV